MPASRLWLVALAVRVHGMHSAPTPMSALKGERPTERRLAHTCSCNKALLWPCAGTAPPPALGACSDRTMRHHCPSVMTERNASREPSRQKMESPTGSPTYWPYLQATRER